MKNNLAPKSQYRSKFSKIESQICIRTGLHSGVSSSPFKPLGVTSIQFLCSITPEWDINITRKKEMITNLRPYWLLDKFSLQVPWEVIIRGECSMYGEDAKWSQGVKG